MSAKQNWPLVKLNDCSCIISGATPKTSDPRYWDGDVSWVTPKDVSDLGGFPFLDSTPRTLTQNGLESCSASILPPHSVLLSSRAPIGLVAINRIPVATNQGFKSFIPDATRLNSGFLYHWLLAHREFLQGLGTGATFKEISKAVVSRIEIPLPPLDEQRRIAAVLDKADALRRQRQESLQLTEKLLQSVFLEMFGTEVSPKCPRVKLADHLEFITTGGRGWAKYYAEDGAPFIRSLDVRMNEIDSSQMVFVTHPKNSEAERTRTRKGDVLLTMTGSLIGRVAPVTAEHAGGYISQHVAILRARDYEPDFLSWALSTQEGQRQIQKHQTGQTKPGLNFEQVKRLLIPRPSIADEKKFCELIRCRRSIIADQRTSLAQFNSLFASAQQRAFRSELDLIRLHLSPEVDEPAIASTPQTTIVEGRYTRPGCFIAPPDLEQQLLAMEKKLEGDKAEPLPWSADFFKYRTLSQILQPPFSFAKIWSAVEQEFEQPSYETVKNKVFEYVAKGVLEQDFSEEQKEIVFRPKS